MDACVQCPPGYECTSWAAPSPCGMGQYSTAGSGVCTFCPIGFFCPQANALPIPCQIGQYQDEKGQSTCKQCPDGFTCVTQTLAPTPCLAGQFTDMFNQQCYTCPAGYDCTSKRFDSLTQCPKGTFSLSGQGYCKQCPAGNYCQYTDQNMVECPPGSYAYEGQTTCTRCPAGYKCLDKKGKYIVRCLAGQYVDSLTLTCTDCTAGYSCPNPEGGYNTMAPCQTGTYSGPGQSICTVCPPGRYCPLTNVLQEIDCPLGSISFGGAAACTPCPQNHECPNTITNSTQIPCPIYFYSAVGSGVCIPCPSGTQCNNLHATNPSACPSGYYIETLDWKCQPCPYGYMCPGNAVTPIICPKQQYQDTMASQACKTCQAGYFSGPGYEFCQPVPAGFTPNTVVGNPALLNVCPEGTYSDWGYPSCLTCVDGFLCPAGGDIGPHYGCPKGSYCIAGVQTQCDPGQYGLIDRARSKAEGCADCPAGYFCLQGTTNFDLYQCPAGMYCPVQTEVPIQCPKGTYNDQFAGKQITDCKLCPMGRQCDVATTDEGTPCAQGYFCPIGSWPGQWPCPAGTYSGYRTNLKDQSECLPCPAGYYCPSASVNPIPVTAGYYQPYLGIGDKGAQIICPPGYYCPNSAMTAFKGFHCTPGYYCPAGSISTKQMPCPEGTYSDSYEIFDASQCYICPAGYKCGFSSTSSSNMTSCPKNQYCPPATKASSTINCLAGSYAPYLNSKSLDDCIPCPYGFYCLTGQDPANCPSGSYCPKSTQYGTQYPCPAGYYLDYTNGKVLGECKPCGIGNYCAAGSSIQTPCPIGQYNDLSNTASQCSACPAGRYCPTTGTSFPPNCIPGKYSDLGASQCSYCEVSTYCPNDGTTITEKTAQICPAGVYCMRQLINQNDVDPITNQAIVVNGPFGLSVYPDLLTYYCTEGYYCPAGTTSMIACPAGTYNKLRGRKTILDCQATDAGYYTDVIALSAPVGPCAAGYYCPAGSISAQQVACPVGTFRSQMYGSIPTDCTICTSGHYCPNTGMPTPTICPQGFYCPLGTSQPEPCPEGTYGGSTGLTDSKSCTLCPPGYYCPQKSLTAATAFCDAGFYCIKGSKRPEPTDLVTGEICPVGGYCPSGTTSPQNCLSGQFNSFTGGQSTADCQQCWPGYYCNGQSILVKCPAGKYCITGTSDPTVTGFIGIAQAGYYAPLGSSQQIQCPRGTYQSQAGQSSCSNCDAGYYCGSTGLTAQTACPIGTYCQAYATFVAAGTYYSSINCPAGTYNPNTAMKTLSGCLPCPQGQYCDIAGRSTVAGSCSAGYFCQSSSTSPTPSTLVANFYGPCPQGYYCPSGVISAQACPIGTFSPQTLATSNAVCQPCTQGYYCPTAGLALPTLQCSAGYYCPEGSAYAQGGTLANPTLVNLCQATYYCPLGTWRQIQCPVGYYQQLTGQGSCNICPKGYYCIFGLQKVCPAGYSCP